MRKLEEDEYDAVVLAVAGLERLELADRITAVLDPDVVLPAVGQGALGLECRGDDAETIARLQTIGDSATHRATAAERAMLSRLRAGCHAPVGVRTGEADDRLWLQGVVLDSEGTRRVEVRSEAEATTVELAGLSADTAGGGKTPPHTYQRRTRMGETRQSAQHHAKAEDTERKYSTRKPPSPTPARYSPSQNYQRTNCQPPVVGGKKQPHTY